MESKKRWKGIEFGQAGSDPGNQPKSGPLGTEYVVFLPSTTHLEPLQDPAGLGTIRHDPPARGLLAKKKAFAEDSVQSRALNECNKRYHLRPVRILSSNGVCGV